MTAAALLVTLPWSVALPLALSVLLPVGVAAAVLGARGRAPSLATTLAARGGILIGLGFAVIASVATLSVLRTGIDEIFARHFRETVGLAQSIGETTSRTSSDRQRDARPRIGLYLASRPAVGAVALRWNECAAGCLNILADTAEAAAARRWLERRRNGALPERALVTLGGRSYLLVTSAVREHEGRPLGDLIVAVDASHVVQQAADTAWLLVALATGLLVAAIITSSRMLAVSVAQRVQAIIARLEGRDPAADDLMPASRDELAVLARSVQAQIDRSLERERESDFQFQRLVDGSPDAIFVTVSGVIRYANGAALRLLGTSNAHQVLERGLDELLEVPPSAASGPAAELRDGSLRTLTGGRTDVEVADIAFTYAGRPALQTTVRDISARKRAEAAQRRTERVYRALVEHASFGMYRADLEHRFLTVNPALVRMLGYADQHELLAADAARMLFADPTQRLAIVAQLRADDRVQDLEVDWTRKDGRRITVRLSGKQVQEDDGAIVGVEFTVEDVTERIALQAQLQQAQKMEAVGQLTAGVAHDFNNLLTVVLTNATLVEDALPAEASAAKGDLGELRQAARRGAALVHKLLAFSRADRLERRAVRVGPLMSDAAYMLRRVLPENIEVRLPAEVPTAAFSADPVAIEQILLNLATNARDAMPGGGTLDLQVNIERVEESEDAGAHIAPGVYVCFRVRDSGHGMDEETQKRIFEPFFTTKPVGAGTGLGMAMVHGLVQHHRGFVRVTSALGAGTTVSVGFPMLEHVPAPPVADVPLAIDGGHPGGMILLVEDEESIRRATTRVLERVGYRVRTAADGVEGLAIARSHQGELALIISDLMMPRMGGKELFDALRAEGVRTPFLFISGYTRESLETFRTLGDEAAFLNKPWETTELLLHVRDRVRRATGARAS